MRRLIVLVLAIVMILSCVGVAFASSRIANIQYNLSFNGAQAICTASYSGDKPSDSISMTLTLFNGNTIISSWSTSGTGFVNFSRRASAPRGSMYTLTVEYSVNGVVQTPVSVSSYNY